MRFQRAPRHEAAARDGVVLYLTDALVELTENMVRAIAKQAEAERDCRAKIIHAEAEFQASQTLVDAAKILERYRFRLTFQPR